MSMKIPMTPAGIETATFRFAAQHLNHCATADSHFDLSQNNYSSAGIWYTDVARKNINQKFITIM
jgi:hypothetical protein